MKIKKGDNVVITAGKDKGRSGKVQEVFPLKNQVLLPGLNIFKKHTKAKSEKQPGGVIDISRPLPTANIALVCPKCNKPTRVGYQVDKSGKKYRICRKCQQLI